MKKIPTHSAITAPSTLTDSTGGVASTTLAAITAPGSNATTSLTADMTAVKNALAQLKLQSDATTTALNAIQSTLNNLIDAR